jgi:hypothetical protein
VNTDSEDHAAHEYAQPVAELPERDDTPYDGSLHQTTARMAA